MASRKPYVDNSVDEQHDAGSDQIADEKKGSAIRTGSIDQVHQLAEKLGDRADGLAPKNDIDFVLDKVESLTVEDCRKILKELLEEHKYDYNFAATQRHKLENLLLGPQQQEGLSTEEWELELKTETAINKLYSPYPEVRAVTTPDDDPNMPCETIRAHLLGYAWACVAQFVNSLFNSRFPQIVLQSQVIQVLLYPCGLFLALALPDWGFNFRGKRVSLNPGPWTYKEQMLSTLIVSVSVSSAVSETLPIKTCWQVEKLST